MAVRTPIPVISVLDAKQKPEFDIVKDGDGNRIVAWRSISKGYAAMR